MSVLMTEAPPAHLWIPPGRRGSYGDEVAGLAEEIGRPLDSAQRVAVDALNSYGPGGRWHALESAVIGPRQTTGKSAAVALPSVLADCLLWPDDTDRVAWTAHLARTHRETFDDVQRLIEGCSSLSARVAKVIDNHDECRVSFTNGTFIEFLVRSPGNGRGLGGRTVVIDEALYFPTSDAGALLPVMAARDNPRVIYASSAAKLTSIHLQALVVRGRSGSDPSLIWCEWCAPGSHAEPGCDNPRCRHQLGAVGCVMDRPEVLRLSNPGVATGRLRLSTLEALRRALAADPTEFGREFMGWHEFAPDVPGKIGKDAWLARVDETSRIEGTRVLAVDVPPDRKAAAIAGSGRRADGARHVGLVDYRPGTGWVVARVVELLDRHDVAFVVLDSASPASALLPDLRQAGLSVRSASNPGGELMVMTAQDMGRACGGLQDGVTGDAPDIWHRGDPIVTQALEDAMPRDIGDGGWGWDRKRTDADICPLVAMTEAAWGISLVPLDYDLSDSFG